MKITIQNLSKAFGGRDIFSDFSLDIDSGVRLCVCGPNGCGKSTLGRMLADADAPDSGRSIMPRGCRVGYVQQDLDEAVLDTPLLEWVVDVLPDWHDFWSAWEAAAASKDEAAIARLGARQAELEALYGYNPEHKAQAVLSGLGFDEGKWHLPIKQLSGGWRERAKLARVPGPTSCCSTSRPTTSTSRRWNGWKISSWITRGRWSSWPTTACSWTGSGRTCCTSAARNLFSARRRSASSWNCRKSLRSRGNARPSA